MDKKIILLAFVSILMLSTTFGSGLVEREAKVTDSGDSEQQLLPANAEKISNYAEITEEATTLGDIGSWNTTSVLPETLWRCPSVVYNGRIYVVGGLDALGSASNRVYYATINSDGTVGSWSATTPLPAARQLHAVVVHSGKIYVIGGYSYANTVYFASIENNGTISSWATTTPLPEGNHGLSALVYNETLYVIGGSSISLGVSPTVYYAQINPNGTLSSWSTTTPLPEGRNFHASVAYNGRIYVINGHYPGGGARNTVYYAQINPNGTLSSWSTTTPTPTYLADHGAVVYNGIIYVIGGYSYAGSTGKQNAVRYGKVNQDGTVSAWTATASLPETRHSHGNVVYNGRIYVIGGSSGESQSGPGTNTVYYSSFMHDVAVGQVTPSATEVYAGQTINISVIAKNEGTVTETFNVSVYYDDALIETITVTNLSSFNTQILSFTWNTSDVAGGYYTISANASVISGEIDIADNTFIDGTVKVTSPVRLVEVIPCNQTGYPKDNFELGAIAYFKVTINSTALIPQDTLITINLYDNATITIGVASFQGPILPGTSTIIFGIPIPTTATIGTATVYTNCYTDWPHLGGFPHCPEKSATLEITGP